MSRILYIIRDIVNNPLFNKKKKTTVTPKTKRLFFYKLSCELYNHFNNLM